jgi:ATP-binding cassette subfamily B protein
MPNNNIINLTKRLWFHIEPRRRKQFGILFFLMIISSFAELISIGAILPFLGVLTSPEKVFIHKFASFFLVYFKISAPAELLFPITVLFIVVTIFSALVRFLLLWAQTRLSFAIGAELSFSVYQKTLYQPYKVHIARNSSELITAIANKVSSVIFSILIPIPVIISSTLIIFTILIALLFINTNVAIISVVGFGIIYLLVILLTKKQVAKESKQISEESVRVIKSLQEGLGGIRDILIDGTQATYCNIYMQSDLKLRRSQANITILGGSPRFAIEALGMALIAILAYSLAIKPEGLSTAIPILGALALGAQRILPILQQAYASYTYMKGGEASLIDTLELLDQELPKFLGRENSNIFVPFNEKIELKNITFQYNSNQKAILDKFNLIIPKGSRVGIIGKTGSGKSTLLDLIMGLIQPNQGQLLIDNVSINENNYRQWQGHIAHVPQSIYLSDASISENIAFGVPRIDIDFERVVAASQKAQIDNVIETWDSKYDTIVGERGVRLSGGQRQRIGIARALYKNADVIIFDEATSALDNETEKEVMDSIRLLGDKLTILIVAHRLSTLKECDFIIELNGGAVSRMGTYNELIK